MLTRPILFAALAAVAATGSADDPPPAKADKSGFSASVSALNGLFKKDATGNLAKKYVGRVVTVSGTVKDVTAADDGSQTVALNGLPPTAEDPSGCTVPFPAGHKSLGVVKGLKAGMTVRVRGTIDGVAGTAFTLKEPTLVSASAAPLAKGGTPAPKPPPPAEPKPPAPKTEPAPSQPALRPEDLKTTVAALTAKLRDDKTEKLWLAYTGKEVELTGPVMDSFRAAAGSGGGRGLWLLGCPSDKPDIPYRVAMMFPADSPDLPRLRNLAEGDAVTVRGEFGLSVGMMVNLKNPKLVAGGEKPPPAPAPVRTAEAEAFVREMLADQASADKLRGRAVALTGAVGGADPRYNSRGLTLRAGKLKPNDSSEVYADCFVAEDQLDAVWQLPPGLKVRVVGVVGPVEKDRVRLTRCQVTLLEPNPMPTVSATELAAAFRADRAAAGQRYGDVGNMKWLFLTGEVAALTPKPEFNSVTVSLKIPAGALKVEFAVWTDQAATMTVGQAVRVKARCSGLSFEKDRVAVGGQPLPEAKTQLPLAK
jgi:hypothetical protein